MADALMNEAEQLAQAKYDVELEIEKAKVDVGYRQNVVTNEKIIADTLIKFGDVIKSLPMEEQKELIQLIVREITVNQFDPKKKKTPLGNGVFKANIRTKWYLVNVSLYENDLISTLSDTSEISSDFPQAGSSGRARTYNLVVNSHPLYH